MDTLYIYLACVSPQIMPLYTLQSLSFREDCFSDVLSFF